MGSRQIHKYIVNPPVENDPNIGLDGDIRRLVVDILNNTLAHWNVSGSRFFELHNLFHSQYKLINEISERIAERTRILGGFATGSLHEFLALARLDEQPDIVPDIFHILADHESSICFLREDLRKCNEEYEDEETFELLVNVMQMNEKMVWILRSYIEPETSHRSNKGD